METREIRKGWGIEADDGYLSYGFYIDKKTAKKDCLVTYWKPVKVVLIRLIDYEKLKGEII